MSAEISRTNSDLSRKGSIVPKTVIEGPPRRDVPILLRQTSFKALSEDIVTEGELSRYSLNDVFEEMANFKYRDGNMFLFAIFFTIGRYLIFLMVY